MMRHAALLLTVASGLLLSGQTKLPPAQLGDFIKSGFLTEPGKRDDGPVEIHVDVTPLFHEVRLPDDAIPVKGQLCELWGTTAVWRGREGIFFCVPDWSGAHLVWARVALEVE